MKGAADLPGCPPGFLGDKVAPQRARSRARVCSRVHAAAQECASGGDRHGLTATVGSSYSRLLQNRQQISRSPVRRLHSALFCTSKRPSGCLCASALVRECVRVYVRECAGPITTLIHQPPALFPSPPFTQPPHPRSDPRRNPVQILTPSSNLLTPHPRLGSLHPKLVRFQNSNFLERSPPYRHHPTTLRGPSPTPA
jgi:hypothetical protein